MRLLKKLADLENALTSLLDGSFFAEAKEKVVGLVNKLGSISKLDLLSPSNKVCQALVVDATKKPHNDPPPLRLAPLLSLLPPTLLWLLVKHHHRTLQAYLLQAAQDLIADVFAGASIKPVSPILTDTAAFFASPPDVCPLVWDIVLLLGDFYSLAPSLLDEVNAGLSSVDDPNQRQSYAQNIQSLRQLLKETPFPSTLVLKLRDLTCQIPELVSVVQSIVTGDSSAETILCGIKVMIGLADQMSDLLTLFKPSNSTASKGNSISSIIGSSFAKIVALTQKLSDIPVGAGTRAITHASNKLKWGVKFANAFKKQKTPLTFSLASTGASLGASLVPLGPRLIDKDPGLQVATFSFSTFPPTGAIQRVLPHPDDPARLYVATVNGGIWGATNANANPSSLILWTSLTSDLEFTSQSFGDLAWDMDAIGYNPNTLVAAHGSWSSYASLGGPLLGLLRYSFQSQKWTHFVNVKLQGVNFRRILSRGSIIVAGGQCPLPAGSLTPAAACLFRTTDGISFSTPKVGGNAFPSCQLDDMAAPISTPGNDRSNILYAFVSGCPLVTSTFPANGLYKSVDTGATWTQLAPPGLDAVANTVSPLSGAARIAVSPDHTRVYLVVFDQGASAVYSALLNVATGVWTQQAQQPTLAGFTPTVLTAQSKDHYRVGVAFEPRAGAIGTPHMPATIYLSGNKGWNGRGALGAAQIVWAPTVDPESTAVQNRIHYDARDVVFDAAGRLLVATSGGVWARANPTLPYNTLPPDPWVSLNSDLSTWFVACLFCLFFFAHPLISICIGRSTPCLTMGFETASWSAPRTTAWPSETQGAPGVPWAGGTEAKWQHTGTHMDAKGKTIITDEFSL
jgi:hypothetical protein